MSQSSNLEGQTSRQIKENTHSNTYSVATLPHYSSEKHALRNSTSYSDSHGSEHSLLPLGARAPEVPPSWYFTDQEAQPRDDSPPLATPLQRLLDPSDSSPQYASYQHRAKGHQPWDVPEVIVVRDDKFNRGWTPVPLRPVFWIPLVLFMMLLAVALEIGLHFSDKNLGWPISGAMSSDSGFVHFLYTLPPVSLAMVIVALLTWTDIEIKKMQPYIDLIHGDSPPQRSLLLDYTRTNNFIVWISAFWNQHFLVAIATLVALGSLVFQPLGAATLTVRDTWWTHPVTNVTNMAALGLNHDPNFSDLTTFISAAGFASSSALYNLGDPMFVHDVYTVGPFQMPEGVTNGTIFANTTAVKSEADCQLATTVSTPVGNGSWMNTATLNGCTFGFMTNKTTPHLFGSDVMPDCGNTGSPPWFLPIIFWFFTYDPNPPQGSATVCAPAISLWDVAVTVDIATGNLTTVVELRPFDASNSPFSSFSGNITGAPLNGLAYNGIGFDMGDADQFVTARAAATDLQLPAAVQQAAESSPGGLPAAFSTNSFPDTATRVYTTYLKMIAKSVYFLPTTQDSIPVQVKSFTKRLWLSDLAVHLEVGILFLLAIITSVVQLLHRESRQDLRFRHQPGTIASAVSIGAQTDLANLLHGQQEQDDFVRALRDKKFRIDPQSMKILMEGEPGYELAASPNPRQSVFARLKLRSRGNRRFSGLGLTPPASR